MFSNIASLPKCLSRLTLRDVIIVSAAKDGWNVDITFKLSHLLGVPFQQYSSQREFCAHYK